MQNSTHILQGIPVSQGIAIGQLWIHEVAFDLNQVEDHFIAKPDRPHEKNDFFKALHLTRADLLHLKNQCTVSCLPDVYISILDSQIFQDNIIKLIELGHCSLFALKKTIQKYLCDFENIENKYLSSRASDLLDLGQRIGLHLQPQPSVPIEDALFPEHIILIDNALSLASLADIPTDRLKGIISSKGSASSHMAILAQTMGIPAVMGVSDLPDNLALSQILINGTTGEVCLFPTKEMIEKMEAASKKIKPIIKNLPINLYVNLDVYSNIDEAKALGAQGVGLYRSEVAFMRYNSFPSEAVQSKIYEEVLHHFAPNPVNIRILDVGSDKPLPYFKPLLDLRGTRMMLAHQDIFLCQVRAMLLASENLNNLKILLPMIASVSDLDACVALIHKAYDQVVEQANITYPEIGAMIEIPCAIFQIDAILQRVDFISVGSNDLNQYILAIDRHDSQGRDIYDGLHPGVLKALDIISKAAHRHNKKISICGAMASNPIAAIVLLGLGFDTLSMPSQSLAIMSSVLSYFTKIQAQDLVEKILLMENAQDIHLYLKNALSQSGWMP